MSASRPPPAERRGAAAAPEPEVLVLTTTGRVSGRPRVVELWFTGRGGRYYVIAETGERAAWIRNIMADPGVQLRVGSLDLAGRARVVDVGREPGLHASARARSEGKYGWGDGLVVEITPEGSKDGAR